MEQATREETMRVLLCQPGWLGARHWWCQNTDYVAGAPEIAKSGLLLGSTEQGGLCLAAEGATRTTSPRGSGGPLVSTGC